MGRDSTRDIANFWFLHAVNTAVAPLRHLLLSKPGHPEELYMEMSRLGGRYAPSPSSRTPEAFR